MIDQERSQLKNNSMISPRLSDATLKIKYLGSWISEKRGIPWNGGESRNLNAFRKAQNHYFLATKSTPVGSRTPRIVPLFWNLRIPQFAQHPVGRVSDAVTGCRIACGEWVPWTKVQSIWKENHKPERRYLNSPSLSHPPQNLEASFQFPNQTQLLSINLSFTIAWKLLEPPIHPPAEA